MLSDNWETLPICAKNSKGGWKSCLGCCCQVLLSLTTFIKNYKLLQKEHIWDTKPKQMQIWECGIKFCIWHLPSDWFKHGEQPAGEKRNTWAKSLKICSFFVVAKVQFDSDRAAELMGRKEEDIFLVGVHVRWLAIVFFLFVLKFIGWNYNAG